MQQMLRTNLENTLTVDQASIRRQLVAEEEQGKESRACERYLIDAYFKGMRHLAGVANPFELVVLEISHAVIFRVFSICLKHLFYLTLFHVTIGHLLFSNTIVFSMNEALFLTILLILDTAGKSKSCMEDVVTVRFVATIKVLLFIAAFLPFLREVA